MYESLVLAGVAWRGDDVHIGVKSTLYHVVHFRHVLCLSYQVQSTEYQRPHGRVVHTNITCRALLVLRSGLPRVEDIRVFEYDTAAMMLCCTSHKRGLMFTFFFAIRTAECGDSCIEAARVLAHSYVPKVVCYVCLCYVCLPLFDVPPHCN